MSFYNSEVRSIVENGGAAKFWADPSEGTASAFCLTNQSAPLLALSD